MKYYLRAFIVLLLLAAAAAAALVYSGIYPIDAASAHPMPLYHILHYTMRRSVAHHSQGISPPRLDDTTRVRSGLALYREYCVQCHGAPGIAPDPLARGMTPEPPNLMPTARGWPPSEIYWAIRQGIKMTAMPAWRYRLSDEQIWDVVAFVEKMRELSPQEYKALDNTGRNTPRPSAPRAPWSPGGQLGDPAAGLRAIHQYLCATCHKIPGIAGEDQNVGPSLAGIGQRQYIAGVLRNTPENMLRWLRDPPAVDPLTAMPNLRLREQDARDIAAYLYTLNEAP